MDANIGFVGYSDTEFDVNQAQVIIDEIFDEIEAKYANLGVVNIISGATNIGIPAMVYKTAVDRTTTGHCKFNTVGIMCKDGYNYKLFPCDAIYAIGDNWGDESQRFLGSINVLYKIGGGKQSINEYERAVASKQIVCKQFEL